MSSVAKATVPFRRMVTGLGVAALLPVTQPAHGQRPTSPEEGRVEALRSDALSRAPHGRSIAAPVASGWRYVEVQRYRAPEARQGVVADAEYFYAIANHRIAKYSRETGEKVAEWIGPPDGPLIHLNSCVVVERRLVCAHSNYPGIPMLSSIEVFDTATMEHVDSHSFGSYEGSLTWVVPHDGAWWAAFAHYGNPGGVPGQGPEWTSLVRFDGDWVRQEEFAFPVALIEQFRPYSTSGGSWGTDGSLYVTGHDAAEVYVLRLPRMGSVLEWIDTRPAPMRGQAWGFDPADPETIWGILRGSGEVVRAELLQAPPPEPGGP